MVSVKIIADGVGSYGASRAENRSFLRHDRSERLMHTCSNVDLMLIRPRVYPERRYPNSRPEPVVVADVSMLK